MSPRCTVLAVRCAALCAALCAIVAGAPACTCGAPPAQPPPVAAPDCDAGDEAFVRQATLAILGRRPLSEAEVQVAVQAIASVDDVEGAGAGRVAWASSLMRDPAYVDRWEQHVLDALFVSRTGVQSLAACYDARDRDVDDPALARFVRDGGALDGDEPDGAFTYRDLLRSSLILDDLSPIYRAHMFAMLTTPNECGNVDPIKQELAVRDEVGTAFDAAYLDRDPVCLACHNSDSSVTDRDDPKEDRHWPLPGSLEAAVFGSSSSVDPQVAHAPFRTTDFLGGGGGGGGGQFFAKDAYCDDTFLQGTCTNGVVDTCGDATQPFCFGPLDAPACTGDLATCANAPFCVDAAFSQADGLLTCTPDGALACATAGYAPACITDVAPACDAASVPFCPPTAAAEGEGEGEGQAQGGTLVPWGADPACGTFATDVPDDPAGVDARLASVAGKRATVVNLEQALHRGVDSLAARGLVVKSDGRVDGADEAFAYLVAVHIVDGVWREVIGSPLTIATHFPRNQASRDTLQRLTDHFVRSHASLQTLLLDVVTSPAFNLQAPAEGCGPAYGVDPIFDPWVRSEPDPAMRNNSPADGLHVLSGRTLLRAAYAALGWPHPGNESFPGGDSASFDQTCLDLPDCTSLQQECATNAHCCAELETLGCSSATLDELELQRGLGIFHGFSEKGFRGVDFQVRLTWEARFGRCQKPAGVARDFIDDLVDRALSAGATLDEATRALKERLIDESELGDDERTALAELDGPLEQDAGAVDTEGNLRAVCGVLLSTPQFQLVGLAPAGGAPSALSPTRADACAALAARGLRGYATSCGDDGTVVLAPE